MPTGFGAGWPGWIGKRYKVGEAFATATCRNTREPDRRSIAQSIFGGTTKIQKEIIARGVGYRFPHATRRRRIDNANVGSRLDLRRL